MTDPSKSDPITSPFPAVTKAECEAIIREAVLAYHADKRHTLNDVYSTVNACMAASRAALVPSAKPKARATVDTFIRTLQPNISALRLADAD